MRKLLRPNHRSEISVRQYFQMPQIKKSDEDKAWMAIGIGINNHILALLTREFDRGKL